MDLRFVFLIPIIWLALALVVAPDHAHAESCMIQVIRKLVRSSQETAAISESLTSLQTAIARQKKAHDALPRKARADNKEYLHSLRIENGKGFLKVGLLERVDAGFGLALLQAVRDGSLVDIDVGKVVGPKVLNLLVKVRGYAPEGHRLTVHGLLSPAVMRESIETFKVGKPNPLKGVDPNYKAYEMSKEDIEHFKTAAKQMQIADACRRLYGTGSLGQCPLLHFKFETNKPGWIEWDLPGAQH